MRFTHEHDYYQAMGRLAQVGAPFMEAGTIPNQQPALSSCTVSSSASVVRSGESLSRPQEQPRITPSSVTCPSSQGDNRTAPLAPPPLHDRPATCSSLISQPSVQPTAMRHTTSGEDDHPVSTGACFSFRHRDIAIKDVSPSQTPSFLAHQEHGIRSPFFELSQGEQSEPALPTTRSWSPGKLSQKTTEPCQPRPYTAPVLESQHLSQVLPPKRDLPFLKPLPRGVAKMVEHVSTLEPSLTLSSSPILPRTTKITNDLTFPSPVPGVRQALSRSRQPVAPTKTRSKRPAPRKAANRSRPETTARAPNRPLAVIASQSPLPSIEALLERAAQSAKEVTAVSNPIDTQDLLADVEARFEPAKCSSTRTKQVVPDLSDPGNPTGLNSVSYPTPVSLTSTGADVIAPAQGFDSQRPGSCSSLKVSYSSAAEVKDSQEFHPDRRLTPMHVRQDTSAESSQTIPVPIRTPLAELGPAINARGQFQDQHRTYNALPQAGPLEQLMQDKAFAPTPDWPSWNKISCAERRAALETFLCHQLHDESFCTLLQDLEGTWQRVFFGR